MCCLCKQSVNLSGIPLSVNAFPHVVQDEETHKWIWKCPQCGNTDQNKMNVARRTCGYIGSNFWNQGRTEEIAERVLHLDNRDIK